MDHGFGSVALLENTDFFRLEANGIDGQFSASACCRFLAGDGLMFPRRNRHSVSVVTAGVTQRAP
jgi:hypothetical protein